MSEFLVNNMFVKIIDVKNCVTVEGFASLEETKSYNQLLLVYEGEGIIERNSQQLNSVCGDLIYYRKGDTASVKSSEDKPLKFYVVTFLYTFITETDGEWALDEKSTLPFPFVTQLGDRTLYEYILMQFERMYKLALPGIGPLYYRRQTIFADMVSRILDSSAESHSYENRRKVNSVIRYMTENLARELTLASLSEHAEVSSSYLGKLFKGVLGKSPIECLIEIRINKAKELLLYGRSVGEVAEEVGFSDIYYFSRTFKKVEGLSPKKWLDAQERIAE